MTEKKIEAVKNTLRKYVGKWVTGNVLAFDSNLYVNEVHHAVRRLILEGADIDSFVGRRDHLKRYRLRGRLDRKQN